MIMGLCVNELRHHVVRPTLERLGVWSTIWENLLLGTIAQASSFGFHVRDGRGLGLYQIDKETHRHVWDRYLAFDPDLASQVRGFASQREFLNQPDAELVTNLAYATVIAWAIYSSNSVILPQDANDINALALCWQQHFPRRQINQNAADFVASYRKHVEPSRSSAVAA
jgi:hypothetical protein